MYSIEISYRTGDSFHTEDTTDIVGHVWDNIEYAKKALQSIKEHYKALEDIPYNETDFRNKYGSQEWCKSKDEYPMYSLLVPNDKGELVSISCFWSGYFETLHGACITIDEEAEDDMSFTM